MEPKAEQKVEIGRPITDDDLQAWYTKHNVTPDAEGYFTALPDGESPVGDAEIVEQVKINALRHEIPNLRGDIYRRCMVYIGGGPTVHDHLEEILAKSLDEDYDVWTSNMTAKFLVSKGIKPKYHVILDPSERVAKRGDLDYDSPETTLILGLQCHPELFEIAKRNERKVFKFLAASATGGEIPDSQAALAACTQDDPEIIGIGGGSMCGTRMMYLASAMGYRELQLYGVDACVSYENGYAKSYAYSKPRGEHILEVEAPDGRKFFSTASLARQVTEIDMLWEHIPGLRLSSFGDSFMTHMVNLRNTTRPRADYLISNEYRDMMAKMHSDHSRFGVVGAQHAPRVFMAAAQLARKTGKCDMLDYGSGKEGLIHAVQSAFPYVPGITYEGYEPARDEAPLLDEYELLTCFDVLEHVEPECVANVMHHIRSLTSWVAIITVSMIPAQKSLPDGRNAHISLHPKDWWLSWLKRYFIVVEQALTPGEEEMLVVLQPIERYLERQAEKNNGQRGPSATAAVEPPPSAAVPTQQGPELV